MYTLCMATLKTIHSDGTATLEVGGNDLRVGGVGESVWYSLDLSSREDLIEAGWAAQATGGASMQRKKSA